MPLSWLFKHRMDQYNKFLLKNKVKMLYHDGKSISLYLKPTKSGKF